VRHALLAVALVLAACDGAGGSGRVSSSSASSGNGSGGARVDGGQGGATGACAACDAVCVDTANDPRHCGACDQACAAHTLCDRGACAVPLCLVVGLQCPNDHVCCGDAVPSDAGACPTACAGCL
jgi:hypothetical protein